MTVLPFSRPGTWVVHGGLRDRAHHCLTQVEVHDAEADRYFAQLKADPSHRARQTEPLSFPDGLRFFSDSTIIAAAMAVEMFMNHYGVVRLGESFYNANYERLGAPHKLVKLLATCCTVLVQQDDEIVQLTKRLFDRRNALVHPKSRDLERAGRGPGQERVPLQKIARDSVMDMERFSTLFHTYDPDVVDLGGV